MVSSFYDCRECGRYVMRGRRHTCERDLTGMCPCSVCRSHGLIHTAQATDA